jgi:hypothetical protein
MHRFNSIGRKRLNVYIESERHPCPFRYLDWFRLILASENSRLLLGRMKVDEGSCCSSCGTVHGPTAQKDDHVRPKHRQHTACEMEVSLQLYGRDQYTRILLPVMLTVAGNGKPANLMLRKDRITQRTGLTA